MDNQVENEIREPDHEEDANTEAELSTDVVPQESSDVLDSEQNGSDGPDVDSEKPIDDDEVAEERARAFIERYTFPEEKTAGRKWRELGLSEDLVYQISSFEGYKKLLRGELSKEERSGLTDDEIDQKAGANKYSAISLGPRYVALRDADPKAIGDDLYKAILEFFEVLAFWSGRCYDQMLRIFKKSELCSKIIIHPDENYPDYEYYVEDAVGELIWIANYNVRTVYKKPERLSPSGWDQNAIIINTGNGPVMLADYHPEENPRYVWNDIGIGNLFADVFKDTAKYCKDRRIWYVYDGRRWVADDNAAMECCKELTLALYAYAKCFNRLRDDDDIKPQLFQQYVKRYHSRRGRETILKDASSVHTVLSSDFDTDRYLFNCLNGTYHLRTKRFTRHSPADMITKMSGVRYNKHSVYPRWEQHINEVTEHDGKPDADLARYIQKCLGYALTGNTKYECGFVFYGPTGRNGKSLTLDTYLKMMDDYGCSTSPDTITQSRLVNGSGPKENIARLAGSRFVCIPEPDKDMQLSESMLKTLTGNDKIVSRNLREGSFEYYPQFKIFINTNYRPLVTDKTVFTRLKVIPFRHHFKENEQDTSLKEQFSQPENLSGIFNWCCAGLDLLESEGLNDPEAVQEAKEIYQEDNNLLDHFIKDTFVTDVNASVLRQEAYDAFKAWCSENGEVKMSKRSFLQAMETVPGIEAARMRIGGGGRDENPRFCFKGIRVRDDVKAKAEAKEKAPSKPKRSRKSKAKSDAGASDEK